MRHLSFRLPEYLYQGLKDFAEPKGMVLSESVRFVISEYLKNKQDSDNILKKLKDIEEKISSLPPGVASDSTEENSEINFDLARIKKALVILGSESSRTKIPLINLFPELNK
ncbi:MAG: hypothetical protein BA871_11670 [Desulfuromonadales bacterium C00003096]|jgi:predicted DNA-binding protein|nr:MAG: hypothetical protein BA871_11670 [Desulfuromonadales bacterium C00003096]